MSRRKKRVLAILGGLTLVLVLLTTAAVVSLRFVDLAPVRAAIVQQVSQQLGAAVQLQRVRVSLWPVPHAVLDDVHLSIPQAVDATCKSVSVYVRLRALLRAKLEPGSVVLDGADLRVHLPDQRGGDESAGRSIGVAEVREKVAAALAGLASAAASQAPGLVLIVRAAAVHLVRESQPVFSFTDLHARVTLPPNPLRIELTCASNLWDHMALSASLDPNTLDGSAHIDLTRLRPQVISALFLPQDGPQLGDSDMNLAARLTTSGLKALQANVEGSFPSLTVRRDAESVLMKGASLKATLHVDERTTTVTLSELRFADPQMRLAGSMSLDSSVPLASAELNGTEIDVPEVRRAALVIAGQADVTRQIFDVIRAGKVPQLTLRSSAPTLAHLGDDNVLVIQGSMSQGQIHVPGVDLDLDDVSGDATVAKNILTGDRVIARHGHARVTDGTLRVGLSGDRPELQVGATVDADVAELPLLLRRLVARPALGHILDRISDARGTAVGKLVLSGTTRDVHAAVDVSQLDVSGRFTGISEPLRIQGGRLLYEGNRVAVTDARLTAGASALSGLSVRVGWGEKQPSIEVTAGASRIVLDEVFPWVAASGLSTFDVKTLGGTLALHSLRVQGPAEVPADWRFELAGAAQKLEVESPWLRDRIAIQYPVALSELRLARDPTAGTTFSAKIEAPNGLSGFIDLVSKPGELHIKQCRLRDADSDATLALVLRQGEFDLKFAGRLSKATVDRLAPSNHVLGGWVRGDFGAHVMIDNPALSTVNGTLEATDVLLLEDGDTQLRAASVSLDGSGPKVRVDAALDAAADSHVRVQGVVNLRSEAFNLDLDVKGSHFDWAHLQRFVPQGAGGDDGGKPAARKQRLRGRLRIALESFTLGGFTWEPLHATLDLNARQPTLTVTEARLCGIATPGTATAGSPDVLLAFKAMATNLELDPTLACLAGQNGLVTGHYGLAANVAGRGRPAEIAKALQGHVEFNARKGRVYHLGTLTKVFSVVSIASGAVWNISQLTKEGLKYETLTVKGDLQSGTLTISEAILDGRSVKVTARGFVDVIGQTADLTLLVAPLKTVDTVVSHVPVVSKIFGGSLVTVPVRVTGRLGDLSVTPLSPSAVGRELMGAMKRTLKLPFRLISPLLPGEGKDQARQ